MGQSTEEIMKAMDLDDLVKVRQEYKDKLKPLESCGCLRAAGYDKARFYRGMIEFLDKEVATRI